jgi:hypothetical protein
MTTMANWLKEHFCNLVYFAEFSVQYISLKQTNKNEEGYENTKTLQCLDTSTQKPAVLVTGEIVVPCPSFPETKSGVSSLVTVEEKWCLHSSPKEKSGMSSFITNDRRVLCLRHRQRRNKSQSSFIMYYGTRVFAHYQ